VSYQPDILVKAAGDPATYLVVEVKLTSDPRTVHEAESALKTYMAEAGIPTGMLVTPVQVRIYRDNFRGSPKESVEDVGDVVTGEIPELQKFAGQGSTDPIAFEDAVQDWLAGLQYRQANGFLRSGDHRHLTEHIGPSLTMGEVRAAGPRARLSAAG